jgi:hypothetical protein
VQKQGGTQLTNKQAERHAQLLAMAPPPGHTEGSSSSSGSDGSAETAANTNVPATAAAASSSLGQGDQKGHFSFDQFASKVKGSEAKSGKG